MQKALTIAAPRGPWPTATPNISITIAPIASTSSGSSGINPEFCSTCIMAAHWAISAAVLAAAMA